MPDKSAQDTRTDQVEAKPQPRKRPLSMHEDVPIWCDCCSCEAEPRWQELADQLERRETADEDED